MPRGVERGKAGRLRRRQSGQAIAAFALCLFVLMGVAGLGVDLGIERMHQTQLQIIADGAALGGASELPYGDVETGATSDAALNGFVSGSGGATLTINNPPLSGPHTGDAGYVEAIASQTETPILMGLFDSTATSVSARAVATLSNGPACAYALDPSASGAVTINGTFNIQLQCTMYVDSKSSTALLANGSGTLDTRSVGVVGGSLLNGTVTVNPAPVGGMLPLPDPLAYLTPPSTSGSCASPTVINGSGNFTLQPGIYCSTLIINGAPNVTFQPGTYVLKSGVIMNGTPTLTGDGVTFYNNAGGLTLNGSATTDLSAPTTGPYAGILVYQSKTDSSQLTINGNNSAVLNGAIYAPDARIVDNGSGAASDYGILVGNTITINGSAGLNDNYSALPGGSPIKSAVLVE